MHAIQNEGGIRRNYFHFWGFTRPHLAKELLYWPLTAAKEVKVLFSLWYSHWWQGCHVLVNNNTSTLMQVTPVKVSGSPKQNSQVEGGPKEKAPRKWRGIREGNGDWL